jgi:inosine-uridine nucleoside N-ribohydrolase
MGNKIGRSTDKPDQSWLDDCHTRPASPFMKNPNEYGFKYTTRVCAYRTERLEISPDEVERIDQLIEQAKNKVESQAFWKEHLKKLTNGDQPLRLIVDTDIGTDCDDALAFLTLINLIKDSQRTIELLGVTTNYYPTKLRAAVAKKMLEAAGLSDVPVFAGSDYGCGGTRDHFLQKHEGKGMEFSNEALNAMFQPEESTAADEFIHECLVKYPKEVVICSIGMCTNLARAVVRMDSKAAESKLEEETFENLVAHVVLMAGGSFMSQHKCNSSKFGQYTGSDKAKWGQDGTGTPWPISGVTTRIPISVNNKGEIDRSYPLPESESEVIEWLKSGKPSPVVLLPNHNSSGDAVATNLLFKKMKCPISLIPHEVTAQYWISGKSIETLLSATLNNELPPESPKFPSYFQITGKLVKEWFKTRGRQRGQCPHDPLTVHEAIFPASKEESSSSERSSTLEYIAGTFVATEWASFFIFVPDEKGCHRLAISPKDKPADWLKWLEDTMLAHVPKELQVDKSPVKTFLMDFD